VYRPYIVPHRFHGFPGFGVHGLPVTHVNLSTGSGAVEWVTAIATCVIAVGLLASWGAIRDNSKTRHAQIAMDMGRRYDEPALKTIKEKIQKWSPERMLQEFRDVENSGGIAVWDLDQLANFFEDLGVLYKMRALKIRWLDETLGTACTDYWHMWSVLTFTQRANETAVTGKKSKLYENWQKAANKISERRGLPMD